MFYVLVYLWIQEPTLARLPAGQATNAERVCITVGVNWPEEHVSRAPLQANAALFTTSDTLIYSASNQLPWDYQPSLGVWLGVQLCVY